MEKQIIKKIDEYVFKIEKTGNMNADVIIFASQKLLEDIKQDDTLIQSKNMASLPGVLNPIVVCPDAHQGYGACIGGVSAMDIEKGTISPGQIGYDINCSVRLLKTNLKIQDIEKFKKQIIEKLFKNVPSGVGEKGKIKLSKEELDEVLKNGAQWAVKNGYGFEKDWKHTEENGKMENANPNDVGQRAKARGIPQLGSLGAGNHFLEIQFIDEIFDDKIAKKFGLEKNQITIMIHCGSRGLGHQVASDYIKLIEKEYGFPEYDRELINAPIKSELGKKYFSAMSCAANFAFANKQMITHWVRQTMKEIFKNFKAEVVYDVCHNIAKFEKHFINGKEKEILVMRKGATRSFGPGRKEIPVDYRSIGQPVIIPGSMGTSSYLLIGTKKAEQISFGSTAHGAGRKESRSKALKNLKGEKIKKELNEKGIEIISGSIKNLAEEAPQVYKNVDEVIEVSDKVGLTKKIARLKPLAVMKG